MDADRGAAWQAAEEPDATPEGARMADRGAVPAGEKVPAPEERGKTWLERKSANTGLATLISRL